MSPGRRSTSNGDVSKIAVHTTSRRLTPNSSTSPSPRHLPVSLPPSTPRMSSLVGRRASIDSNVSSRASTKRRASMSINLGSNASPTDRSISSLRHVGEGVLDDSDSSSSGIEDDDEVAVGLHLNSLRTIPAPSPLSHHVWTEDEEDAIDGEESDDDDSSSPSPQSTDTDSDSPPSPNKTRRFSRVSRRNSGRIKSRSQSFTVASLAALPRPLMHQDSYSSIRTVTAGETSFTGQEASSGFQPEIGSPRQRSIAGHGRQRSQAISELMLNGAKSTLVVDQDERNGLPDDSRLSERRIETIMVEDLKFKETTLCALREALEAFAEDVCFYQNVFFFLF